MKDLFYLRNAETIEELTNFNNAESFNLHMRKVYYTFKDDLGDSLKEFVKFLSRYSMKCLGVSWQKPATMARNFGKSQITIKRYISKLKKLGIIDRVKPARGSHYITYFTNAIELAELPEEKGEENTGKTAVNNAGDIASDTPKMIHLENSETATGTTVEGAFSGQETMTFKAKSKTKYISNKRYKGVEIPANDTVNNTPTNRPKKLDTSFIPSYVAADFIEAAKPFYDDANTVTKLWTKATYAARNLGLCGKTEGAENYTDIVIDAFKTAIYDKKQRAIKGSFFGYFFGVVRNMLSDYIDERQSLFENIVSPVNGLYYDWLEDFQEA